MAVEVPQTINEFNEAWPDGLDSKSQGDDHIRNMKAAIKRTFPNIKGPVRATHEQLSLLASAGVVAVPGMIIMWGGAEDKIPAGWKLCNGVGKISTEMPVPDLRNRFIVGAGNSYAINARGGSESHKHTITVAGHVLTEAQIPAHNHKVGIGPYTPDGVDTKGSDVEPRNVINYPGTYANRTTESIGGGQAHAHTAVSDAVEHRPPFHGLFYIIKD